MTIVEFYDKDHLENIVSTLLFRPDKVIFVGRSTELMDTSVNNYRAALGNGFTIGTQKTGDLKTDFCCRVIPQDDFMAMVAALDEIVREEGECCFDLTGGEDMYLAAVGALFERYKDSVQLHRFNIENGDLTDIDAHKKTSVLGGIKLTVPQLITVYNGSVTSSSPLPKQFDEALWKDIRSMWKVCQKDNMKWNNHIHCMAQLYKRNKSGSPRVLSLGETDYKKAVTNPKDMRNFIHQLFQKGFLTSAVFDKVSHTVRIVFKNELTKTLLTNPGGLLELYVALAASAPKNGESVFSDIRTGVTINWNAGDKSVITNNEIDVILMKGITPVFISCKNGETPVDELYKFATVTRLFGGHHAKMVLVAASCSRNTSAALFQRAEEMGITVIDHQQTANPDQLGKKLRELL